MNDYLFYSTHAIASIILYGLALRMRHKFSGENFTRTKLYLAYIYNITIGSFHFHFTETGNIPFLGVFEKHVMGWLSMIMVILHAASSPTEEIRRSWFKRKKFDPRI